MADITIKKGSVKVEADKDELVDINETADGVVFNFKGGLSIYYTDNFMPSSSKQIIKNTADRMSAKKLIFDLDNTKQPALVDAT